MPAQRLRTERWRDSLDRIRARGGGIELTLASSVKDGGAWPDTTAADLLWRVRVIDVTDDEVIVEQPSAAGHNIDLAPDLELVGVMAVGQNRWMFHTRTIGLAAPADGRRAVGALRLAPPTGVERCQRRSHYRMSTAQIQLPQVDCWPLLDPSSVVAAEVANRALVQDLRTGSQAAAPDDVLVLPEVGPKFRARLLNISGGGLGLGVDHADAHAAEELRLFWFRIDLRPSIPAPIGLTGKIVHTRIDSTMCHYCGVSYEFGFNPSHREFIVREIGEYVSKAQDLQLRRRVG